LKKKKDEAMPAKKYKVRLTDDERQELSSLVSKGKAAARKLTRARILLLADESEAGASWSDDQIVEALAISRRTVERTREKWVESGLEAALNHKRTPHPHSKRLDGDAEARLVQLACSATPDGRDRWTMQMLADKLIELEIVETVSDETVRTTLKKRT
jgi:transposase